MNTETPQKNENMQRVSTNFTLFLKIFVPIFWIVFFGAFTVVLWAVNKVETGAIPIDTARWFMTFLFLTGVTILYFTLLKLHRVEMDEAFVYVTNYIKTARYPYHSIEKIDEKDFLVLSTVTVYFKEKGIFGKKVTFIPSQYRFQGFLNKHPQVVEALVTKK